MKGLKIILWICAICCLLGFVIAVLPWRAMTALFHWIGVQPPTAEPITVYIYRLCMAISGMIGILGEDYPGYFPVGNHRKLADLMLRCERDNDFYLKLLKATRALLPLVDPKREKESWRKLVAELK